MHRILAVLITAALLGACSSSSDRAERSEDYARPRGDLIEGSEDYGGPQTAAISPVSDRRSGRGASESGLHADIQRDIQRQLDRSGIFAGVVALDRPDEGNEAEVIIEPTLVGASGQGGGVGDLRVRVTEKTNRRVVLDERYEAGSRTSALPVAISELEKDLAGRYQR